MRKEYLQNSKIILKLFIFLLSIVAIGEKTYAGSPPPDWNTTYVSQCLQAFGDHGPINFHWLFNEFNPFEYPSHRDCPTNIIFGGSCVTDYNVNWR